MALLGCYLDDSHDQFDKEVFSVAGDYGWSLGFIDAETEWQKGLEPHGPGNFPAGECENVNAQFRKLRGDPRYRTLDSQKAAAAEIREDFISVVNEASEIDGIGLCVPLEAYRNVFTTEPDAEIFLQDRHFYFAYHTLMIELVKRSEV